MSSHAQVQPAKEHRVLIILDASGSMRELWENHQSKYNIATRLIKVLIDSVYNINNDVAFGLRAYGEQYPSGEHNCYDSKLEVMFSKDNRTQMQYRLADIHPDGTAALGYALQDAIHDLSEPQNYIYDIIFITNGTDSCTGDVCKLFDKYSAITSLRTPYVINLSAKSNDFSCLGRYLSVTDEPGFKAAIDTVVKSYRINRKPYTSEAVTAAGKKRNQEKGHAETTLPQTIKTFPSDTVITQQPPDTIMQSDDISTYLLLTSRYNINNLLLYKELTNDKYAPYKSSELIIMPMSHKVPISIGTYRVVYTISDATTKPRDKAKQFIIRYNMDNTVDLD